jgi:hypothetical protein
LIELDWQSSTTGSLNWWIDGAAQTGVSSVNNSSWRMEKVQLGVVGGLDPNTRGTEYFDAFESRRSTYIGPMGGAVVTTTINYVYDNQHPQRQFGLDRRRRPLQQRHAHG